MNVSLRKPPEELSDTELEEELARRRLARSAPQSVPVGDASSRVQRALEALERDREVQQAYANLELPKNAPWADVEAKYRELIARFHPEKHRADQERYRAALDVVAGLTRAYQTLYQRVKR